MAGLGSIPLETRGGGHVPYTDQWGRHSVAPWDEGRLEKPTQKLEKQP